MITPEEVLSYWFPEDFSNADSETRRRQMKWWMAGGPKVDREVTKRFGEVLEQARRGELDHWADTARRRLALIVVLDQFSRNVYRGSPHSYAQDEKALRLAVESIDLGMDRELSVMERYACLQEFLNNSERLRCYESAFARRRSGIRIPSAPL